MICQAYKERERERTAATHKTGEEIVLMAIDIQF